MRAWVDGVLLESGSAAVVAPQEVAGTGDSVFTTVLVVDGRAFAWGRHLARLEASASALGLPEVDRELVARAAREVVAGRPGDQLPDRARMRILWGRAGSGGGHLSVRFTALGTPEPDVRVITPSVRRTPGTAVAGHKTSAYADNLLAVAEARRAGADEAVLLTTDGAVSEGTASNLFWVVDGEVRTAALSTGCLPGIGRALVLEWFGAREVVEEASDVQRAQEMFLTSSTRGVQPVREWGGWSFISPGPVTQQVQERLRERAASDGEWFDLR